mgnify:FL=1
MIIDCFTFNGENAILKLHLSILGDYVDKFIIVEANKTFTGLPKPYYLIRDYRYFKPWWNKIEHYQMNDWDDVALWREAINSPNTVGADHWAREYYIKESIHKVFKAAKIQDNDTLFIGDVDEIIDPHTHLESETPIKAKLRVYSYWLNNRSNEQFWGTLIAQYKDIKDKCLNDLRSDKSLYSKGEFLGWHFTNIGGTEEIRRKLNSSYTVESYNTPQVQELLTQRINTNTDYLGRDFKFQIDESEWPEFLKKNKNKFELLCK